MKYLRGFDLIDHRCERPWPRLWSNAFHFVQDSYLLSQWNMFFEIYKLIPRKGNKKLKRKHGERTEISRILVWFVIFGLPKLVSSVPTAEPTIPDSKTFSPSNDSNATLNSTNPTLFPTMMPTRTFSPSEGPSSSFAPSTVPSSTPTPEPTFQVPIISKAMFTQRFIVGNGREFLSHELGFIMNLYVGFTSQFSNEKNVETKVITKCNITKQNGGPKIRRDRHLGDERRQSLRRGLQSFQFVDIDYEMMYESIYINVTEYPKNFQQYVNSNSGTIVAFFGGLGANVTNLLPAERIVFQPTEAPTVAPTAVPSFLPTEGPSISPTLAPTVKPSVQPTTAPSTNPTAESGGPTTETAVIVVSSAIAATIVIIGLFIFFRKRTFEREQKFQTNALNGGNRPPAQKWNSRLQNLVVQNTVTTSNDYDEKILPEKTPDGMLSASESLISNQSLLSAGNSIRGEDSGDEADATQNLADEFDQYKDQNLEKMRADVEGNLTGFDSMMSQALTRALLDDDDDHIDPIDELLLAGNATFSGAEIEASTLGEVTDWMKRKENFGLDEKRSFMQETLNKMVVRVRQGVLGPDDASRIIHECAALLGLQLATQIPDTTMIVNGMRKTVSAEDMKDTFGKFGQISEAAVAPDRRDFGILRFKTKDSIRLVLERLRVGEILVQDVAVQVNVLNASTQEGTGNDE